MGYIESLGDEIYDLAVGDYVIIPDNAVGMHYQDHTGNPGDTTWNANAIYTYGGTFELGGLQAQYARVPWGEMNLLKVPGLHQNNTNTTIEHDLVTLSDIFPTAWSAVSFSGFQPGDTIAVFGAGPLGLLATYSAVLRGASKVYTVDHTPMRLERAASISSIVTPVDFMESDPVQQILAFEPNGVTRATDCVGMEAIDANGMVVTGIVLEQMVGVVADQGGIGQIGVYMSNGALPSNSRNFPIDDFFIKGLTYHGGVVDPKLLNEQLLQMIVSGVAHPGNVIETAGISLEDLPEYYDRFDHHDEIKVFIDHP